ncbi:MAG: hypothetical protein A2912_00575 [Candidatus Buchananbacteria bacterium RIFCSPLOWO2_01_FULL_40_23b]|uniref:Polymerase nucleotidyl transferase domain-containing protein n=1 Tax=Candidatus Buchananbacteria bacterium RIFCSPLOWO2_01_FULL_40_23b TaxID=1797544 RepID=A0A1G1YT93_9BACT|nr:MAG: hypothetical protein A2912_00575 [Candidatus Buchananbacteria bacterium RIFCSPLOWO2_01_FULL_40_23b]
MLTKQKIITALEAHKAEIRSFGVMKLTLFGSYARGEATAKSDIDFLVEFKKGRGLFDDSYGLQQFLHTLFKKEIDLVKSALVREELKPFIFEGETVEARV